MRLFQFSLINHLGLNHQINRLFLIDFNKELKLKKNKNSESSESDKESEVKTSNTVTISSILSEDLLMSSDVNSSLLSFSSI